MGVRGLFSFIEYSNAYRVIDLVEEARNKQIEIIVDTHSLSRCIVEISITKIAEDYENEFLLLPVGEYDIMGEIYYDFHMAFQECGIRLVWVVDGPKGVDEQCTKQKISTWKSRNELHIEKQDRIFKACYEKKRLEELNNCSPIIDLESGLEQLKRAGAEIIHLLQGEADDFIAHIYKERKSYAILTNDTDYIFFKECNVLFEKMFTFFYQKDKLQLPFIDRHNAGKVFKRPTSFRCAISNSTLVCEAFKFKSHDQLIALSILKGNDFTTAHIQKIAYLTRITKQSHFFPTLAGVARYIISNKINTRNIVKIPEIQKYLRDHPDFEESISFCCSFYSLRSVSANISDSLAVYSVKNQEEYLKDFLARNISTGNINRQCYSIHHGSFFDHICMERLPPNSQSIMDLLGDIRKKIYPYLLSKRRTHVAEWRSRQGKFVNVNVNHDDVVQANEIIGQPDGLRIFDGIWSHAETGPLNYVHEFEDTQKALIMYLLRYIYRRNTNINLQVTAIEFESLFVTVFYQYAKWKKVLLKTSIPRETFLRMRICPSERCLTIVAWLMNMYYTAKYICGGALNLTESFPPPVAMMNGSVLFAFFETFQGNNDRVEHLAKEVKEALPILGKEILKKFRNEYHTLTEF